MNWNKDRHAKISQLGMRRIQGEQEKFERLV
jgi:hypothetical protein